MVLEIAIVILLTLINGALAMSELAIVSARPARLKLMVDKGSTGAAMAITLAKDPGRFLSSVQIGITLVGVLAGAFSGATLGARLSASLIEAGLAANFAQPLGVGSVVVAITYLSLIVGELVPKQIALRAPEKVAARVADRTARGLMTPRHEVETLDASSSKAQILKQLRGMSRSRLPVQDGDADNIIGVLMTRDILVPALMSEPFDLRALLREAPVVQGGQSALEVIDRLRTAPAHMVLVYDEYGHFEGIVTPMDVLEAITGDFPDSETDEPKVVTRADGSYLVAGWMPVDEFADLLSLELDEDRDYETAAGFVLERVGRLPEVAERLYLQNWLIEVVDLDGRRIDKLLVTRVS